MIVDGGFFAANMAKVTQGGYVPLLLASAVYGVVWTLNGIAYKTPFTL